MHKKLLLALLISSPLLTLADGEEVPPRLANRPHSLVMDRETRNAEQSNNESSGNPCIDLMFKPPCGLISIPLFCCMLGAMLMKKAFEESRSKKDQ